MRVMEEGEPGSTPRTLPSDVAASVLARREADEPGVIHCGSAIRVLRLDNDREPTQEKRRVYPRDIFLQSVISRRPKSREQEPGIARDRGRQLIANAEVAKARGGEVPSKLNFMDFLSLVPEGIVVHFFREIISYIEKTEEVLNYHLKVQDFRATPESDQQHTTTLSNFYVDIFFKQASKDNEAETERKEEDNEAETERKEEANEGVDADIVRDGPCMSCDMDVPILVGVTAHVPKVHDALVAFLEKRKKISSDRVCKNKPDEKEGKGAEDSVDLESATKDEKKEEKISAEKTESKKVASDDNTQGTGEEPSTREESHDVAVDLGPLKGLDENFLVASTKDTVIGETKHCRLWMDAKGREMFVVTPKRHVERLSQLSDAELGALFRNSRELLAEQNGYSVKDRAVSTGGWYQSLIINHGTQQTHAHLHLKVRVSGWSFNKAKNSWPTERKKMWVQLKKMTEELVQRGILQERKIPRPCMHYERGRCFRGQNCRYQHKDADKSRSDSPAKRRRTGAPSQDD